MKAISALYLSKAGTKESVNSPVKLVHVSLLVTSPLLFSSPLTIESKLFGNESKELKVYSTSLYSVDFQLHIEVCYLYVIIIYHKLIIDK